MLLATISNHAKRRMCRDLTTEMQGEGVGWECIRYAGYRAIYVKKSSKFSNAGSLCSLFCYA